ncbi:hypothetical protein BG004_000412 [Podila humilis]|nr:hypothetical protein BG004_000412 [Podila humilis]
MIFGFHRMLVFSEFAAADKHEHPNFDKLYACFVQYIGRQRARGNGSASQDILNLEQCRKDYDRMELKGSSRLVRKSSKAVVDSGILKYTKDLLEEVAGGRSLSTPQAAPEREAYSELSEDIRGSTLTTDGSAAVMHAGSVRSSCAGTPLMNASTTPPGTPPSFAALPSCLIPPPAYVNPSSSDSTASSTTSGLASDISPDTSPRFTEITPTAPPPPDDQSIINHEYRTILLSEIEKITHTCQPQEGIECLTCLFKRYQRLCVDALVNIELKIEEIADVVSLIGIFVPSRPTKRMKSVFSEELLEVLISSGEVTHEEWDSVDFDIQLPMKAVRLCMQNRMDDVAATLAPLNKDHRPIRIMLETLYGSMMQTNQNKDSTVQKKLGLRADRPDFTVTVEKTEIAWGEFSGPTHENDKWKNHWDFFRDLRYGKAFLDSGFRLAPLLHVIYEVGTYMRLRTETRGMRKDTPHDPQNNNGQSDAMQSGYMSIADLSC